MSYIVSDVNKSRNDLDKVQKLISKLDSEQQKLVISSSKLSVVEQTKLQLLLGETSAIAANTTATKAQTLSEEDELAQRWLSIGAEEADTVATTANTVAKTENLSIINMLRVAWAKLKAVAASNPLAVGITAIVAATYGAIKASEAWTNRLKKQAQESSNAYKDTLEEIESINSELQSNGQRIDKLNAKENLTLVEAEELERLKESNRELENTLALKEKIAQQEKSEANKDAVKYFNEDTNTYNKETGKFSSTHIERATQYLDEIYKKEQRIHELELEMSRTDDNTEKYHELANELDITQKSYDDLLQRVQDYNDVFTDLDDYLFEGQDDELIQQLDTFYKYMNEVLYGVAETNTNAIRDILAKTNFQDASKQLEELGKSGKLSVTTLSSRFPELIEYLDEAGISAQELYQYIMALSNPDAINYAEVEKQLMESLGIRDGKINGASDQKIWDDIKGAFSEDEWQIALDAYLQVRDQYGKHPEGWTVKDWIANIQSELETEVIGVKVSFDQAWEDSFTSENDAVKELGNSLLELAEQGRLTIETFNNADSTGYFKNLGISADEAVSKINKLVDESKQLSSMSGQISSMAEALGAKLENGFVDADTLSGFDIEVRELDSWDRFQEVLGSTTSSYNECQEAANALATEWVNSSDFLAQLTEQNKEYYETQLQAMGVENYEEVITYAQELNTAKEALSQASFDVATATNDEIQSLIDTGIYSEIAQQQIWNLVLAKQAEEGITLDTSADCQNLLTLAQNAGVTGDAITLLTQLLEIYNNLAAGTYGTNAQVINAAKNKAESLKNQINDIFTNGVKGNTTEIDNRIKVSPSTKSSAKSAGKDTGKSFEDGLKEQLSDLDSVISGITSRIDDQISSVNEQKSAALSAIDEQKEAIESAKDAAVSALEEERQKRLDVIEAQRKQIEENIKAKQKVIDDINAEIKAMQDANKQRKLQNDLMKAQYELARLQQQRVILQYSEDKGMHYVANTKDIRSQKQAVEDAKLEIEIANKEKQIDLIEQEIDKLNEQLDLLDEQEDQVNEHYDQLIKQTEEFYDQQLRGLEKNRKQTESYFESIIKNLENSKSKYQELTEILEKAELSAKLKQLGIDEEALLNGSEEEFNKLKDAYMNIVTQLNSGNDEVLSSLRELSGYDGTAPAVLSDSNTELDEMNGKLDTSNQNVGNVNSSLGETATTTGNVASNVSDLESSLGNVNTLVTEEQTAFNNLKQTIDEVVEAINQKIEAIQQEQNAVGIATSSEMADFLLLKEKILEVKESLDSISNSVTTLDVTPVNNLTTAFQLLYNQLLLVATTLGTGMEGQEEGAVSGITSAIQALNEISLEEGIIAQFDKLKTAIDSVSSAISGGGSSESSGGESQGGGSGSKSKGGESGGSGGKGSEGKGGGGNSLTGAITAMGETASEVIGEPDAEGDGTVIGEFGALETAVNDVTSTIGSDNSEGGKGEGKGSGGEGESHNLIGSIVDLGDTTEETLGEPDGDGVIGRFGQFKDVIAEADEHVHGISEGLDEIDGKEIECTITVNIKTNGSLPSAVGSGMNLGSATYEAKHLGNAHVEGTALASGNWAVQSSENKALVGEEGFEIIVRNGRFFTVGNNGAEMTNIQKGDIVFNHEQSKNLLKYGHISGRGKAYADGTVGGGKVLTPDGRIFEPYDPDKDDSAFSKLYKAWNAHYGNIGKNVEEINKTLSHHLVVEYSQKMNEEVNRFISNSNVVNNNRNVQPVVNGGIHITCPGVTSKEVAQQVGVELNNMFNGLHLDAMQQSMMR